MEGNIKFDPRSPVRSDPNKYESNPNVFDTVEVRPQQSNFGGGSLRDKFKKARPTLEQLNLANAQLRQRGGFKSDDSILDDIDETNGGEASARSKSKKFGTFDGVLARCLLCIWGVIMYLRTGWIVGNAGVYQTIIIMVVASSVTTFTSLSLSAICTNGEVKSGGYYFLISRSLGPEFGGVIGILFAFANCISVAMYLTGFAEAIDSLYEGSFVGGWDIQLWAELTLVLLLLLSFRGVGSIVKFDMVLLFFLIVSIVVFFVGPFGATDPNDSLGYTGLSASTLSDNMAPNYERSEKFITVFSVFFPAVTGEMAGANISGDLKNASYSIPVGTLSAIIISTIVYVLIAITLGASVTRQGLIDDMMVMSKISAFKPLVLVGIFSSTLSSGMSCFVGAPRIFQAVCADNLFPSLSMFAELRESDGEPIKGYLLAFVISFLSILTGNINIIAPIITNFFLITYALMNYSTFMWGTSNSPGWRPTFKYYHPYISLCAAIECLGLMFWIDWIMALLTVIIIVCLYKYVKHIDPQVHWGTASQAYVYMDTCKNLLKYQRMKPSAKVERPTFLIFNTNPRDVEQNFDFATVLNVSKGLIMVAEVIVGSHRNPLVLNQFVQRRQSMNCYAIPPRIIKEAVMEVVIAKTFEAGCRVILQTAGLGAIRPNVVIVNMRTRHPTMALFDSMGAMEEHSDSDHDHSELHLGQLSSKKKHKKKSGVVATLEMTGIHDEIALKSPKESKIAAQITAATPEMAEQGMQPPEYLDVTDEKGEATTADINDLKVQKEHVVPIWITLLRDALTTGCGVVMIKGEALNFLEHHNGYIDIWWLYDDGGLTVLITYLLHQNYNWKGCTLRVMALEALGIEAQNELATLMTRLRIKAEVVPVSAGNMSRSIIDLPAPPDPKDDEYSDYLPDEEPPLQTVKSVKIMIPTEKNAGSADKENATDETTASIDDSDDDQLRSLRTPLKTPADVMVDPDSSGDESDAMIGPSPMKASPHSSSTHGLKSDRIPTVRDIFGKSSGIPIPTKHDKYGQLSSFARSKLRKYRHLGQMIESSSKESALCVITMPFPRTQYKWWEYEMLMNELAPKSMRNVLFVRGNQQQVLTFAL